jgi:hypothetical protein
LIRASSTRGLRGEAEEASSGGVGTDQAQPPEEESGLESRRIKF